MPKPLTDLSDAELVTMLRRESEHVMYSYNAIIAELDRRAANRQARESRILSIVSVVIAVVALVLSALRS